MFSYVSPYVQFSLPLSLKIFAINDFDKSHASNDLHSLLGMPTLLLEMLSQHKKGVGGTRALAHSINPPTPSPQTFHQQSISVVSPLELPCNPIEKPPKMDPPQLGSGVLHTETFHLIHHRELQGTFKLMGPFPLPQTHLQRACAVCERSRLLTIYHDLSHI